MRGGGQEELVFKMRGQLPQYLRPQRIGGVPAHAGWSAVVGLVNDQQVVLAGINRVARGGQGFTEQPQRAFPFEKVDARDEPGKMRPRVDMDAPATAKVTHQD